MAGSNRPLHFPRSAAVLAVALSPAVATSAAIADEPDSETIGVQDPDAVRSPDSADNPSFRPPEAPEGVDEDAGPVVDTDAPTNDAEVDPVDENQAPPPQPTPAPPPSAPATPPPIPPAPPAPAGPPPVPVTPQAVLVSPEPTTPALPQPREATLTATERVVLPVARTRPTAAPAVAPAPQIAARAPVRSRSTATAPKTGAHTVVGARTPYRVKAGDSLWAIAQRVAGPDASQARVAGLVDRLWFINRDRIGTGSPDRIRVGTLIEVPRS